MSKQHALPAAEQRPSVRRNEQPKTIAEQVAESLAIAIVRGEYGTGQRLREQDLVEYYGVSRGPVREAILLLERRGLLDVLPRRGIYTRGVSLDAVADLFNIRASLLGLAARCFTRVQSAGTMANLARRVAAIAEAASRPQTDPTEFALDNGRAGRTIYQNCGNAQLTRMLWEQAGVSLWNLIWRQQAIDFLTRARRQSVAAQWALIEAAIASRDERGAEEATRTLLFVSRDRALEVLATLRGVPVDPAKRLSL